MENNKSGLNPEGITFGIEVEVAAAGFMIKNKKRSLPDPSHFLEHLQQDMALVIADGGLSKEVLSTSAHAGSGSRRPYYENWVITQDYTIWYHIEEMTAKLFPPQHVPSSEELKRVLHGGIEIVSPVFRIIPAQNWRPQIFQLFKPLWENDHLQFNESTGLHVYVGYGGRKIPFPTLLNIAAVLVIFEPVIDKIHPGHRGVVELNIFVKSNKNSACLGPLTNLQVVEWINRCKTVKELQDLVNHSLHIHLGPLRWFKYNFRPLTVIGTIEFRQHAGVFDSEAVRNWILLCTTLVGRAAEIAGEAIKVFASQNELGMEDLRGLIHDPELMEYYGGKLY
ncbi:hypothetical protein RUND412_004295 [Rhizina undulata]